MALIKCKNCGKDISDKAETCIHCNTKIIKNNIETEKELVINDKYNSFWFRLLNNYLINTILTLIFVFLLYYLTSFEHKITYTFMEFINDKIFHGDAFLVVQIFIWGFLLLCLWFLGLNKVTNVLAKIGYVGIILAEILFVLLVESSTYYVILENFYVIIGYTIIWTTYLFITNGKFKKIKKKEKQNSNLEELNKAKELLDKNIITEEEFNKIKEKILKKYIDY